jgi:integrase
MLITDRAVARLANGATRTVRDDKLKGFVVRVGKNRKTYRVELERRTNGKRTFISKKLGEHPYVRADDARRAAMIIVGKHATGIVAPRVTLRQAFEEWKASGKAAPQWIKDCDERFMRSLGHWANEDLASLSDRPDQVRDLHRDLTERRGPSEGNHTMRLLKTIYNNARESHRGLPADLPTSGVAWNQERRADRAIPFDQFPVWAAQVAAIPNPIRRAFHRLCLFTGCRPGELARARWEDVDCKKRTLTIRGTKTGKNIVIPMSAGIAQELKRARDAHRIFDAKSPWVFPAVSTTGHLGQWYDPGLQWNGNAGRHSHRTISADLGIDPLSSRLLLGHSTRDVSEGYVTTALLTGSSLRGAQRKISRRIVELMAGR